MYQKSLLSMLLLATTYAVVFAHEGHGILQGHEPGHYLFSPEHGALLFAAVALIVVLITRKAWQMEKNK